jgi:hypothetical protein
MEMINQILVVFGFQSTEKPTVCSFHQVTYNTSITTPIIATEKQPIDISSCSGWGWYLDLDPDENI